MKKNIAHTFRHLKKLLAEPNLTPFARTKITKELRYIERSYLLTAEASQNMVTTLGRIARLMKRHKENLPPDFLQDLIQIFSTLAEQQEAAKRQAQKLERPQ